MNGRGLQVRIARIFNTYGPRMCIDDGRVVSNFVAQVLLGEGRNTAESLIRQNPIEDFHIIGSGRMD